MGLAWASVNSFVSLGAGQWVWPGHRLMVLYLWGRGIRRVWPGYLCMVLYLYLLGRGFRRVWPGHQ